MSSASRRSSVINTLFVVGVALVISAPALAGTGGAEFSGVYDWFTGLIQGTGGRLLGVLALIGAAVAVSAVSLKVGGIGGLLFVVIASAFGVAFVNSMITALV